MERAYEITTHKANTALAFLRCNLKPCSPYIKTKCYLRNVRPIIEYACTVWAPHTAQAINNVVKWSKGELLDLYITSTIILLAFPACLNHLDGLPYKQEETTSSCY